jgi:alpha-tubulin suppressor-like RCC1 family protein/tetratricopeptide (TPR) repeat protein
MGWRERLSACCIYLAAVPTAISASANIQFTSLSAGETLTCGVAMSGTLYCWGSDERILVGEGKSIDLPIPSVIAPEVRFQSVSLGDSILCGLATSGHVYCWGRAMAANKPTVISETLTFRSVSSGSLSACGVTSNGAVFCWGLGYTHGADVAEFRNNVPVRIQGSVSFDSVSLSTSYNVACGIASDGAGYCWGDVLGHSLGPSRTVPVRVEGATPFRTMSVGRSGVLAIGGDGITYLYPWDFQKVAPKVLDSQIRFATIDARGAHLCGTDKVGAGYCWGGLGSGFQVEDTKPQQVFGKLKFSSMTVGLYHACGLTTEGSAYCWGNGKALGNGLPGDWSIPTPVANAGVTSVAEDRSEGNKPFRSDLAAHSDEAEARLAARRELNSKRLVVMIEAKSGEQLVGSGAGVLFFAGLDRAYIVTAYHLIRPEQKLLLSIKVKFWSKPEHPLEARVTGDWDRSLDLVILRVDGIGSLGLGLYSMPFGQVRHGSPDKGEALYHLGNPGGRTWGSNVAPDHFLEHRGPIEYFESSSIRPGVSGGALLDERREFLGMIRADESGEGEAVSWDTIEGRLRDWGYPVYLGFPPPAPPFVSTTVLGKLNYGVTSDHDVYSWPEVNSDSGESISLINGLKFDEIVSVTDEFALGLCGLGISGDAYCWTTPYSEPGEQVLGDPAKVPGDKRFHSLTVGRLVCGLTSDDQAFCWSKEQVALGDGSVRRSDSPVAVYGNQRFKSISSGLSHTCAVDKDGALYCWGKNSKGDLGLPSAMSSSLPVQVPSKFKFKSVSCGSDSTCAITEDGKAYCWGGNEYGQLGNGTKIGSIAPVAVLASSKFHMISVGNGYACAITTDGAAICWGLNGDGELGNNTFKSSPVPVAVAGSLRFSSVRAGYSRTIGNATSGATYTWGMVMEKTDDTDTQHSAVPRAAPGDSDLASVECIVAYRVDGDYSKAEQAAEEAIQKYPDSTSVVYEVAQLFAEIGKADRTRAGIQKLRNLGEDRIALLRIATLESRIGDFDAMAKDLDRAEKLSESGEQIREVRMRRAISHSEIGQLATAAAEYRQILSEDPHNALVLNNLAYDLAQENGPLQAAYDMAAEAVASSPENSNQLDTLGFICNRMSRFPEAREHLEHALANQGVNNPDILEHIGDTYSKLGDAAGAQAMWRKALQRREAEPRKLRRPSIMERLQQKLAAPPK